MELLTMEKKIKVLEHAFAASAGAYYSINLTQNLVPGTMYQVIDDEEYSINEQIGMPDNAAFFDFFEISNLLKCYANGETHVWHRYWTKTALFEPMLAEQHIVMFDDEETGDVLAISYVLDQTEEFRKQQNNQLLEEKNNELEKMLDVERKYSDITFGLSKVYWQIYSVDLKEDTYIEVFNGYEFGNEHLRRNAGAQTRFNNNVHRFVAEDYLDTMYSFLDHRTLAGRLSNTDSVSLDFYTTSGQWLSATYIAQKRDESGKVTNVLFTIKNNEVGTMIKVRTAEAGITFEVGKQELAVPYVYGSPTHLRKIFLNIYGNCIKYNKINGSLKTSMECLGVEENMVTYQWHISDTGIGMSEEFLNHIYEPFVQENAEDRGEYHGTGLGMSIVKNLIEKMNDSIEISSEKGIGTTFVITIPFEIAEKPEEDVADVGSESASIADLHLMLVEDNELNIEIAETILRDHGAKVTSVTDGFQAVELFKECKSGTFDAVLMDVMMPVMNGLEATKAIRLLERPDAKTIPIIAMTANAFKEDEQKCLEAGMNAHLAKPLDIREVISVIAYFCRKQDDFDI